MRALLCLTILLGTAGVAAAKKPHCASAVRDAVKDAYPGAKIEKCRAKDDGTLVSLHTRDMRKLELTVSSDGTIVSSAQDTVVKALPPVVLKAFRAKYGDALTPRSAQRIELADGSKQYRLVWKLKKKKRRTAIFAADGTFVSQE
jgi:hypothetical protein